MAENIYQPTPNPAQPGVATSPFGVATINAPGSDYASTFSYATSSLYSEAIKREIIDIAPKQYLALKLLYEMQFQSVNSDEHKWLEKDFQRPEILVTSWDHATGVITLTGTYTSAETLPATRGDIIQAANGTPLLVTDRSYSAVADSSTITVIAQTGGSLTSGLISATDYLAIQGPVIGDGMNEFLHYDRLTTSEKYNYIQRFSRSCRWGTWEMKKAVNTANTNYIELDKKEKINQIRVDMFASMFNGTRGEFLIPGVTSGDTPAKTMYGIYPMMVNAGAPTATVTTSGLREAVKALAFESNHKAEGATRVLYGTDQRLTDVSESYKETKTRFQPTDKIANLNLDQITIGTMNLVLVPCELFKERTVFPEAWKDRILCVDQETIKPTVMFSAPHIDMGQTDNKQSGSYRDYTDWWVEAQLGLEYANPAGGFYINIT